MKKKKRTILIWVIALVCVIFLGLLIYFLIPKEITAEKLTARLDKFPELTGKTPLKITLLTEKGVEEKQKQNPDLFVDAVEGDYVIEYDNLLVLYSYKENKIKRELNYQRLVLG